MTGRAGVRFQTACIDVLSKIKRDPEIRDGILDYKAFKHELIEKEHLFRKQLAEWKKTTREAMKIPQLEKDIESIKRTTVSLFRKKAKEMGGIYATAVAQYPYGIESAVFGRTMYYGAYRRRRLFYK